MPPTVFAGADPLPEEALTAAAPPLYPRPEVLDAPLELPHEKAQKGAEAIGLTPARSVERLRVEAARRLLSDSRLPVKRISQRCGFGSEETMRRSFLRVLSVAPQDYRQRFSS